MVDQPESVPPAVFTATRTGRRLHKLVASRIETGEELITWGRAWVSRDGRFNPVVAARSRDFVVLTSRRLMIWSTGFFSRLPRRRVLTERLSELALEPLGDSAGRWRLRIQNRTVLRLEVGRVAQSQTLGRELAALVTVRRPSETP